MAITSLGSIGGASQKVSSATITFSPSQTLSVGDYAFVWANRDSNWFFAPDEEMNATMKCEDDGGNYWANVFCSYVVGDGRSNLTALFYCRVRDTLDTGTTITLTTNFATGVSGFPAWGVSGWAFSCDPAKRLASICEETVRDGSNLAAIPDTTISNLPNQENLIIYALGAEAPSTDAYTWDSDYTQIDTYGTTGSFPTSNWTILGGFRIATLTTDTVSTTALTGTRRYQTMLAAFTEVDYSPYLPSAPVLDYFDRANEDPLATPPWSTTDHPGFGSAYLRVVSDAAAMSTTGTGVGSQWWGTSFTSSDFECYFTQTAGSVAAGYFHATGDGNVSNLDAYGWGRGKPQSYWVDYAYWFGLPSFNGDPQGFDDVYVYAPLVLPNREGCQFISPVIHFWLGPGAAWEWVAAAYMTSTVKTGGKTGISAYGDPATRLDEYGAGDAVAPSSSVQLPFLGAGP